MATSAGLGSHIHAIRAKHAWKIVAALVPCQRGSLQKVMKSCIFFVSHFFR
jgi:hypothetical protein